MGVVELERDVARQQRLGLSRGAPRAGDVTGGDRGEGPRAELDRGQLDGRADVELVLARLLAEPVIAAARS